MRNNKNDSPIQRHGQSTLPVLSITTAVSLGILTGLIVGITTAVIWLAIVIGLAVAVVIALLCAAIYFKSDFKRYMKIRKM